MHRFNKQLTESGEFVTAQGLNLPEDARVVRAKKDGTLAVTDGPFAEAKEFLAGSGLSTWTAPNGPTRLPPKYRRHRAALENL